MWASIVWVCMMGRSVSGGSSWRSWRGSRAEGELDVGLGFGLVPLHGSKTSLCMCSTGYCHVVSRSL
ncbi:hypothetical protein K466DRAFT_84138 [Polyporus arcularius HHB13444]|uniref:Secreted protein n=1 Tax=Polyporus arcularius HHB13444 TaxID=1314778 RepID=A0A5C3PIX4_9APHY|nr:hypothetical protein K466DRAFT_84138 [Polyporus arcularius HHB13444]